MGGAPLKISVTSTVRFRSSGFTSARVSPRSSSTPSSFTTSRKCCGYSMLNGWPSLIPHIFRMAGSVRISRPSMVRAPKVYCGPGVTWMMRSTFFAGSSMRRSTWDWTCRRPSRLRRCSILATTASTAFWLKTSPAFRLAAFSHSERGTFAPVTCTVPNE